MNLVIINAVPLNGGDEALLRATLFLLEKTYPNANITVLCNDLIHTRKHFPDITLAGDLNYVFNRYFKRWSIDHCKILIRKIFFTNLDISKVLGIPYFLLTKEEKKTKNIFKHSDLIISSPGGYLHDFYNTKERLEVINLLKGMNKCVVLFGQSVGPFWKSANASFFLKTFNAVNLILLRESISFEHLKKIGATNPATFVTTDTAFVLYKKYPQLFRLRQRPNNKIALAFRLWQNDGENIIQMAKNICIFLLGSSTVELTFLSTCQGVPNYKDDSLIAKTIIDQLPESLQKRCSIDENKYSVPGLIEQYSQYDAYIGMRLHGAIMAMLGGTPAFNIGYENKTEGIYHFLGLPKQHIFYTESEKKIKEKIDSFLKNLPNLGNDFLEFKIKHAATTAEKNMYYLKQFYDRP